MGTVSAARYLVTFPARFVILLLSENSVVLGLSGETIKFAGGIQVLLERLEASLQPGLEGMAHNDR